MSDIFLSYKREDELNVTRLVNALQKHELSVWWDRYLPGGEPWREGIETELAAAKCVVVVWTEASAGPKGQFVRDEAARGNARGILVPVLMAPKPPQVPVGFGELQAFDLSTWRGSPKDPFVLDLVEAIRAKIEDRPVPPPKGPMKRLLRRLVFGAMGAGLAMLLGAVANNSLGLLDKLCMVPIGQPAISDMCGALRLGNRPASKERMAWEARPTGSCDALRTHIATFPDGVYRGPAADMIAARRKSESESWIPEEKPLTLQTGWDAPAEPDETRAKAAALQRSQGQAERMCSDFAVTGQASFKAARVEPLEWFCRQVAGGRVCGFGGRAVCVLEGRRITEHETCDAK